MLSASVLALSRPLASLASLVFTTALNVSQNTNSLLADLPNTAQLNNSSSAQNEPPIPASNIISNNEYHVICDGSSCGTSLNPISYAKALNTIPINRHLSYLGQRTKGVFDTNLPHRFISVQWTMMLLIPLTYCQSVC